MLTVNPQQYTTYNLVAGDNPITFGSGTDVYAATGDGVFGAAGTAWSVTNSGTIKPTKGDGIALESGGTVNNDTGGKIGGAIGIYITGAAGFVTNETGASIVGSVVLVDGGSVTNETGGSIGGVNLSDGGSVTNETGGTIASGVVVGNGGSVTNAGSMGPISAFVAAAVVTNETGGSIYNNRHEGFNNYLYGDGVYLQYGGSVTNAGGIFGATGLQIDGDPGVVSNQKGGHIGGQLGWGVDLSAGGSVTNAGQISGLGGYLFNHDFTFVGGGLEILAAAAVVTNLAGGSIAGSGGCAVYLSDGGSVTNAGVIKETGDFPGNIASVLIARTMGVVTNQMGGSISGSYGWGVYLDAGGFVTNAGSILGKSAVWVLGAAGVVKNQAGGSISGSYGWGVFLNAGGSVTNSGLISGTPGIGYDVFTPGGGVEIRGAAGVVTNKRGGSIAGALADGFGVELLLGGSVTNAGLISGQVSVVFGGSGENTLTLQGGSTLIGAAMGSVSGSNSLILQGAGIASNTFENFNTLTVQTGGWWTLGGSSTFATANIAGGTLRIMGTYIESGGETTLGDASGQVGHLDIGSTGIYDITDHFGVALLGTSPASGILNVGLFEKTGGILTSVVAADILNWGTISSTHNVLDLQGALTGTGALKVSQGATIEVDGSVGANLKLRFNASSAGEFFLNDLDVGGQQLFHGFITGWAAGDSVGVGTAFGAGTKAVFQENASNTSGVLSLTNGTAHASITFTGANSPSDFVPTVDSLGATVFTY